MFLSKDPYKLTSIDDEGNRLSLIPAEVQGYFKKRRDLVHSILLFIFLVLPWIHIHGQQLILMNVPAREFIFFGMLFKAHDTPLLFFLLISFALSLAFVTAVWGRVWCGWACPQTVFIEAVFRRLERWTEGSYIERRRLQNAPLSWRKLRQTGFKWILFIFISTLIAHSFIAYFTGSAELLQMMQQPPQENWSYFLLVFGVSALVLFDFGWFREQFCVIMCPYGRLQSVLLEPSSLAIVYDQARGEPRREVALAKRVPSGDCISCNRCVEVCPTGIDIRNGLQMECIACTACVDACDEIMARMKKPTGLIAYKTLDGSRPTIFKLKTVAYGVLILAALGGLAYSLRTREPINIAILRGLETPYTITTGDDGTPQVLNHFRVHVTNQTNADMVYHLTLDPLDQQRGLKLTMAQSELNLKADGAETWHLFVQVARSSLPPSGQLSFKIEIQDQNNSRYERELLLMGPPR